jgi:serine/threonine protein kinase
MSEDDREREDGPTPLLPGAMLAPGYRVIAHLRRGRDLDAYDLWSDERGSRCVGKTVRPDRLDARGVRSRLLREGRLLRRLTHPHIVRAYEVLVSPAPVVILETLPGETLAHLIERQRTWLRVADIAQLGVHLCAAIGYLHRQGVLHLDLKPSNIIVTHGLAKVLDLSIARAAGPHRGGIGTPGYQSPEQTVGGYLGPPTDVWGLGATLYEAATGEPACDAADETGEREVEPCQPAPVRRFRRLPSILAAAIDRGLSANPASRPTVDELTVVLSSLAPHTLV